MPRHLGIPALSKDLGFGFVLASIGGNFGDVRALFGVRSQKMAIHLRCLCSKILALIAKTQGVKLMQFSVGGIIVTNCRIGIVAVLP
jgi:hypothetical protein